MAKDLVPSKEANVIIGTTGDLSQGFSSGHSFLKEMAPAMVKIMSGMEQRS